MVGPQFEPELMSWLRSFGSFGTVLVSSFGSAASEPVAAAPAALGRPWKYFGLRERLAEQLRADDLPVHLELRAVRLVRERSLARRR